MLADESEIQIVGKDLLFVCREVRINENEVPCGE
jgi:hypothetical protein